MTGSSYQKNQMLKIDLEKGDPTWFGAWSDWN